MFSLLQQKLTMVCFVGFVAKEIGEARSCNEEPISNTRRNQVYIHVCPGSLNMQLLTKNEQKLGKIK